MGGIGALLEDRHHHRTLAVVLLLALASSALFRADPGERRSG